MCWFGSFLKVHIYIIKTGRYIICATTEHGIDITGNNRLSRFSDLELLNVEFQLLDGLIDNGAIPGGCVQGSGTI